MKKYRNEWKYYCSERQLFYLNTKLNVLMKRDSHTQAGGIYVVKSLYFDDYKDICARSTEAGDSKRYKWRIRYYGNDPKTLKLERKEKIYGRCYKDTCPLSIAEYDAIMSNDVSELLWHTRKPLLKKFCLAIMTRHFTPKVIIDYERTAYVDIITNVRITFDKNVTASYEVDKFLSNDYIKFPMVNYGKQLVEVKFDEILPSYIRKIVNTECMAQQSNSKYYRGRKIMEGVLR